MKPGVELVSKQTTIDSSECCLQANQTTLDNLISRAISSFCTDFVNPVLTNEKTFTKVINLSQPRTQAHFTDVEPGYEVGAVPDHQPVKKDLRLS